MQYIIDFVDTTTDELIQQYLQDNDCLIIRSFDAFKKVYLVESITMPAQTDIVQSIVNDSENPISLLSYPVEEGNKYPLVEFETDALEHWWKVASSFKPDLDASSQTVPRRGANATIYVVDSGVNADHPEFEFADVSTLYTFNGDTTDFNGHGTAIASIIAGKTCAISAAKVKALKVFQSGAPTLQSHLLAAFDAIISDVQANPTSFPIVNLSWSIPKNAYIEHKIREMLSYNIAVVVAAGNNGVPIEDVTPASMPDVCTVGAYTQDFVPADFSNYTGDISNTASEVNLGAIDVWSPGTSIRVATLDGSVGWANGTSMAAAIHSAAIAYNSHRNVFADGSLPDVVKRDILFIAVKAIGNEGILTLDGRYAQSVNAVTRYSTLLDGQNGVMLGSSKTITIPTVSGKKIEQMLYNELITDSMLISEPLPEGLVMNGHWLAGTIHTTEPFLWQSPISYTTHGGRLIEGTLTVAVMPEGMTADEPSVDPEIKDVMLLAACGSVLQPDGKNYACEGTCGVAGGSCINACFPEVSKDPYVMFCYCDGGGTEECP